MRKYSEAFKLQVVQEYLDGPLGYSLDEEICHSWYRFRPTMRESFPSIRVGRPETKIKGGPSMCRKPNKLPGKQAKPTSLSREVLERENERLRLENAYLKKLKAFRENLDAFLEKHKQQCSGIRTQRRRIQTEGYPFSRWHSIRNVVLPGETTGKNRPGWAPKRTDPSPFLSVQRAVRV